MSYTIKLSYKDIMNLMREIAKLEHKKLKPEERKTVINYISKNTTEATKDFNLRLQKKVESVYQYNPKDWKKLAGTLLEVDKNLEIVRELTEGGKPIKEQIKDFGERTGKCKATYFNYKRRLGKV